MRKALERGLGKTILGWVGYFVAIIVVLYLFAPASWWQFGVTSAEIREDGSDFSLRRLEGGDKWNFSEQRGKVVLVNYWATWCAPCRFEMPGLVNIAGEYQTKGVEVVGVNVDEEVENVKPFVENYEIKFPVLLYGRDPNIGSKQMSLPTTFLYDKKGRLAKRYTGIVLESTLKSDIEDLLGEN